MPTSVDAGRRGPRRDAVVNREALLAAAAATLAESADASLDAIARAAGLSRRSVYGHFANRDELVLALIDTGAERLNAIAAGVDHDDAAVAIALLGARLWDAVEHVRLLAAMAVREPYVHRVGVALDPVRLRLRELVERGWAQGVIRQDMPSDVLAHLIERSALAVLGEAVAPGALTETSAASADEASARPAQNRAAHPSPTAVHPSPAHAHPSPAPAHPSPAPAHPSPAHAHPSPAPAHPSPAPAHPSPAPARLATRDARRLVMLAVLGTSGLSWREAGALIDATPALAPAAAIPTPAPATPGTTATTTGPTAPGTRTPEEPRP